MAFELGWCNPWGGPYHPEHKPMMEYLSTEMKPGGVINSTHLIWGRGAAKTTAGQIKLLKVATQDMPGLPLWWAEPRDRDLDRVFMRNWKENVPENMWTYKKGDRQLIIYNGTATPTLVDLLSRNVDDPSKKANLGPTYAGGFFDEAAVKFNLQRFSDIKATIRHRKAKYLFCDTLSTPQRNGFYNMVMMNESGNQPGFKDVSRIINASSYDNPFISKHAIDSFAMEMSPEYYQQEVMGQFVSLEGRVWDSFSEEDYPNGNMVDIEWDPRREWFLGIDPGSALGHWQIWQYHMLPGCDEEVGVVVAEGLQRSEMVQKPLNIVLDEYVKTSGNYPVRVGTGHDAGGVAAATGPAIGMVLNQMGFKNWTYPRRSNRFKAVQHQVLSSRILDKLGRRRFCISKKIRRHSTKPTRETWGILHAMRNAQYPPPGSTDHFHKDKKEAGVSNTEDPMDSALYLVMAIHPPKYRYTEARAA